MLSILLQDYFKHDSVYRLHHIYYSVKSVLNKIFYKKLKQDIEFLSHRSAFYHSKHYTKASMLKKKNKVYLL